MKLYANPLHALGGGGVAPPDDLATQPWGRIYFRVSGGRFLPTRWRAAARR